MMKILKWLLAIIVVLAIVLVGLLWYLGVFSTVKVTEREIGPFTYVYEKYVGPYQNTGPVFDKVYKALKTDGIESLLGIGIYYDNPKTVPTTKLRSDCGSIIEAKDLRKLVKLEKKYQVAMLDKSNCLVAELPIKSVLSYMIGPAKAYPAMTKYAIAKGLKAGLVFELYDMPHSKILYVMQIIK